MGFIQKIIGGMSEDKKELKLKFKEAQQNQKVQRMLEDRDKSSNERELERYMKKKRESQIKSQIDKIHKQQNKESWKGDFMFGGKANILKDDMNILKNDKPILLQKSIFLDNKTNIPLTGERMFFKY